MKFAHEMHRPLPDSNWGTITKEAEAHDNAQYYEATGLLMFKDKPGPQSVFTIAKNHPTHWVVIMRSQCFERDNGWSVRYWPKAKISYESALEHAADKRDPQIS